MQLKQQLPVLMQMQMPKQQLPVLMQMLLLAIGAGADADVLVDARQILLPVGDVAADGAWSLYSGEEGYARALQDLASDNSRHDGLASAAFAAAGGNGARSRCASRQARRRGGRAAAITWCMSGR